MLAEESEAVAHNYVHHLLSNISQVVEEGITSKEFKKGTAEEIARTSSRQQIDFINLRTVENGYRPPFIRNLIL